MWVAKNVVLNVIGTQAQAELREQLAEEFPTSTGTGREFVANWACRKTLGDLAGDLAEVQMKLMLSPDHGNDDMQQQMEKRALSLLIGHLLGR